MEEINRFGKMRELSFEDIAAMKGNGSSMRTVLKCFIERGANVLLMYEHIGKPTERFFLVRYEGLTIPLRAYDLNFYSVFNSAVSLTITNDKLKSQTALEAWDVPVPETVLYTNLDEARTFIGRHESTVVKPRQGSHGEGITVGVRGDAELDKAIQSAKSVDSDVLLQQYVRGEDHRLLFINYEFAAAVQRIPASVVGDGKSTVHELIDARNTSVRNQWKDIRNGVQGADSVAGSISKIPIDEVIAARGSAILHKIPAKGETVRLLDKANVSLGGQTRDVTDSVNPELASAISSLLRNIGLPLCGVDVMSTNISSPLGEKRSYVIELNAAPGLRLHESPMEGKPRHVCDMVADALIEHYRNLP